MRHGIQPLAHLAKPSGTHTAWAVPPDSESPATFGYDDHSDHSLMYVTFRCPSCGQSQHSLEFQDESGELRCLCGWKKPLAAADIAGETPNHCLVCGTLDLWRQKDFPPILGVFFVAVGAIASSIAVYYYHPLWALGILMALALLDMVLYQVMGDVLVCYRCQARHGKVDLTGRVAYDHELGERYRQEEIRMQANSNPSTPRSST